MGKERGYVNLLQGRGWNKGLGNTLKCCICGKIFPRSKSKIKSKNVFCSIECKAKGMSLGLCKSMRLGTGCDEKTSYLKRKYYKYKHLDKRNNVEPPDYSVWDLVVRLKNGVCIYCGYNEDLGLDRINNSSGHTISNTVVSCELCNMTRGGRFTVEEMKLIGKLIRQIRKQRMEVIKPQ